MHDVDPFRWLHNHPWRWFVSIVLSGGYQQDIYYSDKRKTASERIRFVNFFFGSNRYHAIRYLPKGKAWTLVLVPPKMKRSNWGYWDSVQQKHVVDDQIGHLSSHVEKFGKKRLFD